MTAVGIKIEFVTQKWPDLLKMARGGQLQMWQLGNRSTSTEGYGFLGLLYGGNAGLAEPRRASSSADYDRLYDASRQLPDGPERAKLMREMSQIVAAYAPWKINAYRYENVIAVPVGRGLQAQRVQHPSVAIPRHRHQGAAQGRAVSDASRALRSLPRALARVARMRRASRRPTRTRCCASRSARPRRASIRRPSPTSTRATSTARSSSRCSATTIRARPHKVVPNTAAALPEGSKDGTRVDDPGQAGHLLRRRSGVQGQEARAHRRRLRVHVEAHRSTRRCARRSSSSSTARSSAWTRCSRRRRRPASSTTTRRSRACRSSTSYTLKLKLNYPWWDLAGRPHERRQRARSRAKWSRPTATRSGWVMANPVGTGPYRLKEWRRGQKHRAGGQPGVPRHSVRREQRSGRHAPSTRACSGKTLPLIGRVEICDPRGEPIRACSRSRRATSTTSTCPTDLVPNVMEPDNTLKPRFAKAGVLLERGVQPSITYTYFNMEDPVVGGYTNDKSRCAARSAWRTTPTRRSASSGRGRAGRDA